MLRLSYALATKWSPFSEDKKEEGPIVAYGEFDERTHVIYLSEYAFRFIYQEWKAKNGITLVLEHFTKTKWGYNADSKTFHIPMRTHTGPVVIEKERGIPFDASFPWHEICEALSELAEAVKMQHSQIDFKNLTCR